MSRTRRLVGGLTALTATGLLLVGVPAGLIRYVGWPLPRRLPTVDEIGLALRSGVDPRLLINILAIVVWIAWAQLVVAVGVEVTAAIRGRTSRRAPVMPAIQTAAARLVATITLAVATLAPLRPEAVLAYPPPIVAVTADISIPTYSIQGQPRQPDFNATQVTNHESPDGPEYRVGRFDTLWAIAENALGDGRRWTEIRDLNIGSPTATGGSISLESEHVPPGTSLRLPADATLPDRVAEDTVAAREVTVAEGDSFWKIAERTVHHVWDRQPSSVEVAEYWRQLIDANRDRLAPPNDPDLIYPGQVFHLPTVPSSQTVTAVDPELQPTSELPPPSVDPNPETKPPPAPPREDTAPDRAVEEGNDPTIEVTEPDRPASTPTDALEDPPAEAEDSTDTGDEASPLLPVAAGLAGLGLLAAGAIAVLDRLRRIQIRRRRPGTFPTPPPATAAETEVVLRAAAAPDASELIDLALRGMARLITDSHVTPPQVVGVHLSDQLLRLLLWTPHHEPPTGWTLDDDGYSWILPTNVDLTHLHLLADTIPAPHPTLVTVGHDDSGSQLLLDLEHLGATQITGNPGNVAAVCQTMAIELATSRTADMIEIICVGFGHDLEHLERVTAVDSLSDVIAAVHQKAAVLEAQDTTPLEGRLAPGGDAWAPLVIIDPSAGRPEGAEHLLAIAHQGRAICALVGYPTGGQWRLNISDGTVAVHPLGYSCHRRDLSPAEQTGIADLTRAAKDLEGIPQPRTVNTSSMPPGDETNTGKAAASQHVEDRETVTTPEVRVLGVVRVDGISEQFPESRCLELVAYLALHRQAVESDTIIEALYPGRPPSPRRLTDILNRARRTLGNDPEGNPYVPYHQGGLYQVNPHLGCDLDRFAHHIRAADQSEDNSIPHLQAALELVEGTPFSGTKKAYGWAYAEGITTHATVAVDNAAHRLARLALEADQPDLATWAARRGLTASWACEVCYRNLMRAAIIQNETRALDAIYDELNALADHEEGPDATDWLEPETIDLYQTHRQWRRHAG